MTESDDRVVSNVHALIADLLPVLAPQAHFDRDEGSVIIPVSDTERARVSTDSLIRACSAQPQHTWPTLLASWLQQMTAQAARTPSASPGDLRERLRLRIVPRLDEQVAESLVTLPYGQHFDALLVADHPYHVESLTREQVAQLGTEQEIRQLAMINTVQHELKTLDVRDHQVTATESVRVLAGDQSPYVSSALLAVQRFLSGPAPHGALISVPRFSMVLLYEIASDAVIDFAAVFAEMTQSMNADAPDPCSPEIFWWLNGDFFSVRIDAPDSQGRRQIGLPDELQQVVHGLPRAHG